MDISFAYVIPAVILIIAGCAGLLWCSSRSFRRRNDAGMEEFKSYSHMIAARLIEGIVAITSAIAIAAGAIACLKGFHVPMPEFIDEQWSKIFSK